MQILQIFELYLCLGHFQQGLVHGLNLKALCLSFLHSVPQVSLKSSIVFVITHEYTIATCYRTLR